MKKISLSIIIPTYRRIDKLTLIMNELYRQIPKNISSEILICDNKKQKFYNELIKYKKKNLSVKFLLCLRNSNSIKRNIGLENAKGQNIILIDDDCLPAKNFINDYLNLFNKINDKEIICGSVTYFFNKNYFENFKRYRQSRHFMISNLKINKHNYLPASKIVTMNMGIKNSKSFKKTKYFNKNFGRYGFEDFEFGYRLIKSGFKFYQCKPLVYHLDERNFKKFLNKIYFLSRYSVNVIKKINNEAWKDTIFYKIETNITLRFMLKFKIIINSFKLLENIIINIEKNSFLYLPRLYKFAIFLSYCKGLYDRKKLEKKINNYWYE